MEDNISTVLRAKSFALAEQTIAVLPEQSRIMTLLVGDIEHTYSVIIELIHALIDSIESGNSDELLRKAQQLSLSNAKGKVPIRHTFEQIRQFRQLLLSEIQKYGESLTNVEQWKELLSLQQIIHEQIDLFAETYIGSYEQADKGISSEGEPFPEYDRWFKDVVWNELSRLVMLSREIGVLIIDKNLIIQEVNLALTKLLNVDRGEILGHNIDDIFQPQKNHRFIQRVVERGEHGHYVAEFSGRWFTISTRPLYLHDELWGVIVVVRDLTHYKALEEELSKREALASVGQLAAGMAHEIRNPLTSIKGFIQLIQEQSTTKQHDSYYSVILAEIERIDGLINDVLVLARYRDDKIVLENFQVIEEVIGVVRLLEPETNRHNITIELKVDAVNTRIHGYRARIKQVFLNLLKNALEALVDHGTTIYVNVFTTNDHVVVTVEDDGPGIPPNLIKHLFVPFFTTKSEGTGLGLSTSQRIVTDHGGRIFANNSENYGGARFEVRLPLLKDR